jgi:hypothetical protein
MRFHSITLFVASSRKRASILMGLALIATTGVSTGFAQSSGVVYPSTPFISPAAGTYSTGRTVTISESTAGSTIYYTTDGTTPTSKSLQYTVPLQIPTGWVTETIRAVAVKGGHSGSSTSSTFVIVPALPEPTFSIAGGYFMSAQSVSLAASPLGGAIYYTMDGTTPTTKSQIYNGTPIPVAEKTTIKAFVSGVGRYAASPVASQTYSIVPATPWLSPGAGTYKTGQSVKISDTTPGATVYYTTDGTSPTTSSAKYTGPIAIPSEPITETIKAFAVFGGINGGNAVATYTISPLSAVPVPVISPVSGSFKTNQLVTIKDSLAGASIYYTLDGSTPTTGSATYAAPFYIPAGQTGTVVIKAVATKSGSTLSGVGQATITLNLSKGTIANTVVTSETPVGTIATDFLGFSHEWGVAETLMGDKATGVNTSYRTLVSTLAKKMGGPLVLRIGGGSTDSSGPATAATVEPFIEMAQATNVKFILGVNLGSNNLQLAQQQAEVFSKLPSNALAALEIGNEPDGYSSDGTRPTSYGWDDYLPQYQQWQQGVSRQNNSTVPVAGPAMAGGSWIADAEGSEGLATLSPAMVTQHRYVACYYSYSPLANNILLEPSSATSSLSTLQPFVAATHQMNVPFRLGETNSLCNGGQPGVSNTFSSALWAVDTMFEMAKIGVDGVNWHSDFDNGAYDLFHFSSPSNGKYFLLQVRPLYYGLLFFAEAAGNNAQLLSTSTLTSGNVKVWATVDGTGHAHLVVINKEVSLSGNVQITLPGYSSGAVTTLEGANYQATSGITIGGQTFDGSADGTLQGSAASTTVYPVDGVWTIPVNAMSAVTVNLQQ